MKASFRSGDLDPVQIDTYTERGRELAMAIQ